MRIYGKLVVGLFALGAVSGTAVAQEPVGVNFGNTTVTIGGGTAILDLPDVNFTTVYNEAVAPSVFGGQIEDSGDFFDEIGFNINGSIATPIGGNQQLVIGGFFSQIENDDRSSCFDNAAGTSRCSWVNIDGSGNLISLTGGGETVTINSDRDVDHWGASIESRWLAGPALMGITKAPSARYFAAGAEVRGIDQELSLRANNPVGPVTANYNEDLDTRYYGGYLAYGGDYTPMLFSGLFERMGLKTSFQARAGVYFVDADYSGRMTNGGAQFGSLNLSEEDVAFIGGLSLTTSKQISPRASLSLRSDYEYYSWVPDMSYASASPATFGGGSAATRIDDDDAFSMRTSLRLTIKLGPDSVMESYK